MATGPQAIERLAQAAAIRGTKVWRTARALREARLDLWPHAAPGGGKGAVHVEPHHLAAATIALALGEILGAPQVVPTYRDLKPARSRRTRTRADAHGVVTQTIEPEGPSAPVFPGETFGAALSGLIDRLARDPEELARWRSHGLSLALGTGDIWAAIRATISADPEGGGSVEQADYYAPPQPGLPGVVPPREAAPVFKGNVEIPFPIIETCAELWADTLARRGARPRPSSGQALASTGPENENAALAGAASSGAFPARAANRKGVLPNRTNPIAADSTGQGLSVRRHRTGGSRARSPDPPRPHAL